MNATQLETQGHSSIKGLCMESGAEHATQLETQGHSSKAYVWNQGLNIHVLHKSSTYMYTCQNASNCATFRLCKFIFIYVHVRRIDHWLNNAAQLCYSALSYKTPVYCISYL